MAKPVKLFELGPEDWMKGLSVYRTKAEGGLFQQATAFDPFRTPGVYRPVRSATQVGSGVIDTAIKQLVGVNVQNTPCFYGFGGAKLYEINQLTSNVANVTSTLDVSGNKGAIFHKGKIIWFNDGTGGADSGVIWAATPAGTLGNAPGSPKDISPDTGDMLETEHPPVVGVNRDIYFPNGQYVGRITNLADGAGNNGRLFDMGDGYVVRQVLFDGQYMVILADNNTNSSGTPANQLGTFTCSVAWWDGSGLTLLKRWDFQDSFIIGGGVLDGNVEILARNNKYITNLVTPPKIQLPFTGGHVFGSDLIPNSNPHTIIVNNGVLSYAASNGIVSYGNPHGGKKIYYTPIDPTSVTAMNFGFTNGAWWTVNSSNGLFRHDGGNRTTPNLLTTNFSLDRLWIPKFVKLYLDTAMVSGDEVTLNVTNNSTGGVYTMTISHATYGPVKTKIAPFVAASAPGTVYLSDINVNLITNGPRVRRFEVWAEPLEETNDPNF